MSRDKPDTPDKAGMRQRFGAWGSHFVNHHTQPEWLAGLSIMLLWAVVAFADLGLLFGVGAVAFGVVLHYVAMESGSHTWMWLATGAVLLYVLVAYVSFLSDVGPIALTVGGASALAYNETVRVNHMRRRDAEIDPSVFVGSAVAIAVAGGIGLVGITAVVVIGDETPRAWTWMPAAALAVIAVTYLLVVLPTVRVPENSDRRWVPGTRLPPPDAGD